MTKANSVINFEIDGKKVTAKANETILEVARREGIYIPTMCYLTKVKPIASCRLCVVEAEGYDAPILSCQERAVEGLKVTTNSDELFTQRQNIMKLYDVNHPLECGVCPKSGECHLQNKTLEFEVNQQDFAAVDHKREIENWGSISYDPYLCILCERCVRVSNEIVGDEALQISPGGYNSKIINVKKDDLNVDWGECAAVCPVGALSDTSFKYSSNPWELERIPASCIHTPLASPIYYEKKREKIFRVRNESEFDSLNGVCRYGYDFENRGSNSDEDMQKALDAFNKADTIKFGSIITNEEAQILQKLKELKGYKLINNEALAYSKFLKAYSSTSGSSLYNGTTESIKNSDAVIVIGTRVADDFPSIKFKINNALKHKKAEVIYMHPMEDLSIQNIVTQFVKYEPGSEESVLAMLVSSIIGEKEFGVELDEGYISAESNVGEEEIDEILSRLKRKESISIVVGTDLLFHPRAENIAKIIGLLESKAGFDVLIIPPSVNTLGVSQICKLDESEGDYTIGYNTTGDFILSSIEDKGDVNMPAINQQEGTFTNIDKKVVPTNVALPFDGFCLNDIANNLGLDEEYTINYTLTLPSSKGYKKIEFDDLKDYFDANGNAHRGYDLKIKQLKGSGKIDELNEIDSYDGTIVYLCNPNYQKNIFTNICTNLPKDAYLLGSPQFAVSAKIKDGDSVGVVIDGVEIQREFKQSDNLKGTIALMPSFDLGFEGVELNENYRFHKAKVKQVKA
jgi:NADH-quinone oxidoreductase subunit G